MYVPDIFKLTDRAAAFALMRAHAFALLATTRGGALQATHLPFLLDEEGGPEGRLLAHMARANPHWRDFGSLDGEALVIFQGPHAYISPSWYGPGPAVPTWNYLAVHAYGTPRVIEDGPAVRALVERLVKTYETGRLPGWSLESQEEIYVERMLKGIVAFEIPIARLEAKAKLSQNKDAPTREAVAEALTADGDASAESLASAMRALTSTD